MVPNTTFNTISVISWRADLLVEETEGPVKENDRPGLYHQYICDKHIYVYWLPEDHGKSSKESKTLLDI